MLSLTFAVPGLPWTPYPGRSWGMWQATALSLIGSGQSFSEALSKKIARRFRALLKGALVEIPGFWALSISHETGRKGQLREQTQE